MSDLGMDAKVRLMTDATTGKAIASRRGLGKVRHIEVSNLWVQEKVKDGDIEIIKIKNDFTPADILTKYLAEMPMMQCLESLSARFLDGRHPLAPTFTKATKVDLNMLYGGSAKEQEQSRPWWVRTKEVPNDSPADPRCHWSSCTKQEAG